MHNHQRQFDPMEHFKGRIELDGQVRVEHIIGLLQIRTDRAGRTRWQGSFEVPADFDLDSRRTYRLVLEDGRSGEILFGDIQPLDGRLVFVGSGPLA
jgi:hypothetical protein